MTHIGKVMEMCRSHLSSVYRPWQARRWRLHSAVLSTLRRYLLGVCRRADMAGRRPALDGGAVRG